MLSWSMTLFQSWVLINQIACKLRPISNTHMSPVWFISLVQPVYHWLVAILMPFLNLAVLIMCCFAVLWSFIPQEANGAVMLQDDSSKCAVDLTYWLKWQQGLFSISFPCWAGSLINIHSSSKEAVAAWNVDLSTEKWKKNIIITKKIYFVVS